jgi:hypothetical protein
MLFFNLRRNMLCEPRNQARGANSKIRHITRQFIALFTACRLSFRPASVLVKRFPRLSLEQPSSGDVETKTSLSVEHAKSQIETVLFCIG